MAVSNRTIVTHFLMKLGWVLRHAQIKTFSRFSSGAPFAAPSEGKLTSLKVAFVFLGIGPL